MGIILCKVGIVRTFVELCRTSRAAIPACRVYYSAWRPFVDSFWASLWKIPNFIVFTRSRMQHKFHEAVHFFQLAILVGQLFLLLFSWHCSRHLHQGLLLIRREFWRSWNSPSSNNNVIVVGKRRRNRAAKTVIVDWELSSRHSVDPSTNCWNYCRLKRATSLPIDCYPTAMIGRFFQNWRKNLLGTYWRFDRGSTSSAKNYLFKEGRQRTDHDWEWDATDLLKHKALQVNWQNRRWLNTFERILCSYQISRTERRLAACMQ